MPAGNEAVKKVLQAFEEAEWTEIHLSYGDVEIHISAQEGRTDPAETSHGFSKSSGNDVIQVTSTGGGEASSAAASGADIEPAAPAAGGETDLDRSVVVPSPTPGIFWRAPSPGAPPFVEVGGRVSRGDPLCIVEVMKLMSTMPAPVDGAVVRICAENGEQVESQRVLFHIVPDER